LFNIAQNGTLFSSLESSVEDEILEDFTLRIKFLKIFDIFEDSEKTFLLGSSSEKNAGISTVGSIFHDGRLVTSNRLDFTGRSEVIPKRSEQALVGFIGVDNELRES
jgi:hypothetical protein